MNPERPPRSWLTDARDYAGEALISALDRLIGRNA